MKDTFHAIIDTELDPEFEKQCEEIAASRKNRGMLHVHQVYKHLSVYLSLRKITDYLNCTNNLCEQNRFIVTHVYTVTHFIYMQEDVAQNVGNIYYTPYLEYSYERKYTFHMCMSFIALLINVNDLLCFQGRPRRKMFLHFT